MICFPPAANPGSPRPLATLAAALLLATAAPASAQQDLAQRYGAVLEQCYGAAADSAGRKACIGRMADTCIAREPGGESTLGSAQCLAAEGRVWDRFLNAEYRRTLDWMRGLDRDEAETFPEYAVRVDRLRAAQRAWIGFRDGECDLEYALWGAGSLRHISGAACLMRMTAERTIELREKREIFE